MALSFIKSSLKMVEPEVKLEGDDKALKHLLHESMAGWEPARDHSQVHASDLTKPDFCPREFCLCDTTGKKPKGQFIGTSLRATFDLGKALQELLNHKWGAKWCMGTWKCLHCGSVYKFCHKPEACDDCLRHDFQYFEELFIHKYGFTGSLDYIFHNWVGPCKVTEVKTIVKDDFKKLVAPLAEHRLRTVLYLEMALEDKTRGKFFNKEEASVLYICKGFGAADGSLKEAGLSDSGFSPFKEYIVKRDPELVAPIIEKGKQVYDFRKGGVLPARICPTSLCKRAKDCPVRVQCWVGVQ